VVLTPRWGFKRTAKATLSGALKGFWNGLDARFIADRR